ncbi:MAG: hypothetical protein ACYTFQ_22935, partial [Planctomycetota bacterium]
MTRKIGRRDFLGLFGAGVPAVLLPRALGDARASETGGKSRARFKDGWSNPPLEFSQAPFWFWNDNLTEEEIIRQLDDFRAHGVYGFVIHPRAGLPRSIGWMSDNMIRFMRVAIEQAAKRKMWVVLYDEGMYPSGSSSGQVVAENPAFRTRGLFAVDIDAEGEPELTEGQNLVAIVKRKTNGHRIAVIDRAMRPGRSVIRGLHFVEDDPPRRDNHKEVRENMPPAADI